MTIFTIVSYKMHIINAPSTIIRQRNASKLLTHVAPNVTITPSV